MATNEFHIAGLSDLYAKLQQLPAKIEGNIMRGAMRAGLNVIKAAAQDNVPVGQGDLRDSIRVRARGKSLEYGWVRLHLVAGGKKAYYAHWVENGTAEHIIASKKKLQRKTRRGMRDMSLKTMNKMLNAGSLVIGNQLVGPVVLHPGARPRPYMRPAFDTTHEQALSTVADYIRKRLPRELKKAGV